MDSKAGGIRKRQQISKANRVMFLWIVGVSAIVGFSIVITVFLVQRIWFGERVLIEKMNTISTLEKNIEVVPELEDNVRLLNTNENLLAVRANDSDTALQSVLDALPADANSTALASSLQTKILQGVPGVTIETLSVEEVGDVNDLAFSDVVSSDPMSGTIGFRFVVSTTQQNQNKLRTVLQRIEESIRPFNVVELTVESQGQRLVMTVTGVGYYEPPQKIELIEKVVKP